MYAKCGSIDNARSVFDSMQSKDVISWNAMIGGYAQNGDGRKALELFKQMQEQGIKPNNITFTTILSTCAELASLSIGKEIQTQIDRSGIEWNIEMKNSLLNMYAKCGSMDDAHS